jgi:hypothetical protein
MIYKVSLRPRWWLVSRPALTLQGMRHKLYSLVRRANGKNGLTERVSHCVSGLVLFLACVTASAGESRMQLEQQKVLSSKAFLDAHPDVKFRTLGLESLDGGRIDVAREFFLKAAKFADKPSQAMLAEMAWKGVGQPADRSLGYVWADLAAERGYSQFVLLREHYWSRLSEEERIRAIEIGRPIMDEYGDGLAKKRMSDHLRKARRSMLTGRPRKDVTVIIPGPSGQPIFIRGHHFYADKFWDPEKYHQWVDEIWNAAPAGRVEIGPLEQLEKQE